MTFGSPSQPALQTVIHLGARRGERVQAFRDGGARQILLVEPEAGMAADLRRRFAGDPGIQVIAAAAGARDGKAELLVMSLPELNSLAAPAPGLAALYPGLRQERRQEVDVLAPQSLLRGIDPAARPLLLVIEATGTEMALLEAWKAAGLLERVDHLELRCGEEALHAGATARTGIEAWLAAEGFALTRRDLDDPDWPVLHLRADQDARARARSGARIAELERTAQTQAAALAEARAAIRNGSATLEELGAELERVTVQAATLDKALAEAKATTEANAAALAETEAKLKAATDRGATLDKTVATLREQVARLKEVAERDQFDLRAARHDLGLALRVQARLQTDLGDLQARHAGALAEKAEHEELLRQLTPRLREAAQHLQTLSLLEPTPPPAPALPQKAAKDGKTAKGRKASKG